jgi:hypothetical protein
MFSTEQVACPQTDQFVPHLTISGRTKGAQPTSRLRVADYRAKTKLHNIVYEGYTIIGQLCRFKQNSANRSGEDREITQASRSDSVRGCSKDRNDGPAMEQHHQGPQPKIDVGNGRADRQGPRGKRS